MSDKVCIEEGCQRLATGRRSACRPHHRIRADAARIARGGGPFVRPTLQERFWSQVDQSAGPDACWPWNGLRSPKGYGRIYVNGQMSVASRVSYELHHGVLGDGRVAMHTCDNPPCVNPAHLMDGTVSDNHLDMMRKGRHHLAISLEEGRRIEALFAEGKRYAEVSALTGRSKRSLACWMHRVRHGLIFYAQATQ